MKFLIVLIAVIAVVWGSLFITILSQTHKTNTLLQNDYKLLSQNTAILNGERQTQADLKNKIADLTAHVDCLFNLATQGNPYARVDNASNCIITAPKPTNNTKNSPAPTQSSQPASSPPANQPTTNPPQPSCILNILGLRIC